jgi:hypothetical protein
VQEACLPAGQDTEHPAQVPLPDAWQEVGGAIDWGTKTTPPQLPSVCGDGETVMQEDRSIVADR